MKYSDNQLSLGNQVITIISIAFVIVFTSVYLIISVPLAETFLLDPDQGVQLAKGQQILNSIHPFIHMENGVYGPLVFYTAALAQYVLAGRLLAEVAVSIIGFVTAYVILFYMMNSIHRNKLVTITLVVLLVLLMPRFYKYYIVLGPAIFALTLLYYSLGRNYKVLVLALGVALLGLYRIDFGVHATITSFIIIIANNIKCKLTIFRELTLLLISILSLVSPWVLFLIYNGNLLEMINTFFASTMGLASGLSLPAPRFNPNLSLLSLHNLFSVQFKFLFSVPYLSLLLILLLRNQIVHEKLIFMLGLSIFSILLFSQALHRTDYSHFLQVLPLQVVLLYVNILLAKQLFRNNNKIYVKSGCMIVIIVSLIVGFSFLKTINYTNPTPILIKIKTMRQNFKLFVLEKEKYLDSVYKVTSNVNVKNNIELIKYIGSVTEENDPILVLPFHPQIYYFANRVFLSNRGHLFPGVFKNPARENEFIRSMGSTNIVVDFSELSYDGKQSRHLGSYANDLTTYIDNHFLEINRINNIIVYNRYSNSNKQH